MPVLEVRIQIMLSVVLFALVNGAGLTASANPQMDLRCVRLFQSDKDLSPAVMNELADLRRQMQSSEDSAFVSRLETDFQRKVDELEAWGLPRARVLQLIRDVLRTKTMSEDSEARRHEQKVHDQKEQLLQIIPNFELIARTLLGPDDLQRFNDQGLRDNSNSSLSMSGVMWGGSETGVDRYVALRPSTQKQLTPIYDLESKLKLPYQPSRGLLSRTSPHFAEQIGDQFKIIDLRTLKTVHEGRGQIIGEADLLTDDFVVTKVHRRSVQGDVYWMHHRKFGSFDLGEYFGLSLKFQRLAFFHRGQLRVVDLNTGRDLPLSVELTVAEIPTDTFFRRDVYFFNRNGERKLLWLEDLSVHEIPQGRVKVEMLPGEPIMAYHQRVNSVDLVHFKNLKTGHTEAVPGLSFVYNRDRKQVLVSPRSNESVTLIDVVTWNRTELNQPYESFEGRGRFLYARVVKKAAGVKHFIYDIKNQQSKQIEYGGYLSPLATGDFWVMDEVNGKKSAWLTSFEELGQPLAPMGEGPHRTGVSPSGRMFVQSFNQQIQILAIPDLNTKSPAKGGAP